MVTTGVCVTDLPFPTSCWASDQHTKALSSVHWNNGVMKMRATELSASQTPRKVRVASRIVRGAGTQLCCHLLFPPPSILSLPLAEFPCFILFALGWVWCFLFVCLFVFLTYLRKWWEESAGWEETSYFSCCYLALEFLLHLCVFITFC